MHLVSYAQTYLLLLIVTVGPSRNMKKNVISSDGKYIHRLCRDSELLMASRPQETSTVKMGFTS